ncbi:RNA cap guanine-N2 methyltransferase (macronuclear) [Tetrahymena thermophila SB210]|uniref:Trimethylguanosine synthase n=1 Tax=Tetrahymena thermophila (strain SB210) TaxID=312017 RepID=I7MGH3_TETTS|nr:RNA cap guanine-N2 methyltransferase [Tetrahymena thermophila SB210]EAS01447.2 RNA cap guanine-N2 methyltransferase [Tetrahymena thermophila SB210]|eukprot:XP_001021693.2 RNA cap guanine-N2 methyltransferase [Tetrahymena thermophila SB210]
MFNCCLKNNQKHDDDDNGNKKKDKRLKSQINMKTINTNDESISQLQDTKHYTNNLTVTKTDIQNNMNANTGIHNQQGYISEKSILSHLNSEKKNHRDTVETHNNNNNNYNSFFTSGMNTPNYDYNFKGQDINQSDKKGNQQVATEKDKTIACSLDASNLEHFQKIFEKKQVKDQQFVQQIDQQVKQRFLLNKFFFLRDQGNKYVTLAYCSYQAFYVNGGTFNYSLASNKSTQSILNNTSLLFKAAPNQNLNVSKQINTSQDSINSQNNSTIFTTSKVQNNNVDFLNYQSLYAKFKVDMDQTENFTPQKIAFHIAQKFKKYPILIDACCGIGGNTVQFSKINKFVFAVDQSYRAIKTCNENIKNHKQDVSNVEFIQADFLSLECGELGQLRADIVFINPQIDMISETTKPDIFKHSSPNLLKAMKNAYRMSKNIAILLPYYIDINQIPILLDKFYRIYRNFPLDMIQHHCPHIEIIYMNGKIKYFLILLGDASKISQEDEIKFLQEYILDNSPYKGPYEEKVLELLNTILRKVGMFKLIRCLAKSIDINDLQKQKNLLNSFSDELEKEGIIHQKEIKNMLNLTNNISNVCESASDLVGSPNQFPNSFTSQQSFQLNVQQGSLVQSQELNQQLPKATSSKQISFDKDSQSNSFYGGGVESSLGDLLEKKDSLSENDISDNYSNNESDFYFDEYNNIPIDGNKINLNVNNQIKSI